MVNHLTSQPREHMQIYNLLQYPHFILHKIHSSNHKQTSKTYIQTSNVLSSRLSKRKRVYNPLTAQTAKMRSGEVEPVKQWPRGRLNRHPLTSQESPGSYSRKCSIPTKKQVAGLHLISSFLQILDFYQLRCSWLGSVENPGTWRNDHFLNSSSCKMA